MLRLTVAFKLLETANEKLSRDVVAKEEEAGEEDEDQEEEEEECRHRLTMVAD